MFYPVSFSKKVNNHGVVGHFSINRIPKQNSILFFWLANESQCSLTVYACYITSNERWRRETAETCSGHLKQRKTNCRLCIHLSFILWRQPAMETKWGKIAGICRCRPPVHCEQTRYFMSLHYGAMDRIRPVICRIVLALKSRRRRLFWRMSALLFRVLWRENSRSWITN